MFKTIANAFRDKDIRRRILLTIGVLFLYRLGCFIPIPGLNIGNIETALGGNDFMGILNSINGNALMNGTLFALGIIPFINAFIIMQLMTLIIPKLERLSKEGDEGRAKVTQITRYVAIGLAIVQAIGITIAWKDSFDLTFGSALVTKIFVVAILVGGSTLVMWLGERITEYGIGNGTSLIIFIGILSSAGTAIINALGSIKDEPNNLWRILGFLIMVLLVFLLIVFIDLSERKVNVKYGKQVKGNKMYGGQSSHIPMKVNASGVMPIIFASSFLMFPQMIASFWPTGSFYAWYTKWLGMGSPIYMIVMTIFIIFFAYFYAQIQFNPIDVARNIQQRNGFIPGIRPGKPTSEYLAKINNRITLFGAIFLAFIALVPSIAFTLVAGNMELVNAFSATGLLIVVSVALEFNKQLEAQIMMKHYKGFLD